MASTVEVQRLIVRLVGDGKSVVSMLDKVAAKLRTFGMAMTKYVTVPLTGIGAMAVREFAKFDQAMTESTSIMSVTTEQMEQMRKKALELAKTSAKGPDELARAYFYLASAGLDAEQAMAALPAVSAFATAGAFDLAKATDLVTDAQSALGLTVKDAAKNLENMTRVSDVLVRANTLANASVEQFSIALTSKAGSAFKVFNKDVEEGVAVLAAMADQGIKAELAGNNMARIMLLLSKASLDNQEAFKKYNFSVFDSTGKMRNFADIVENLEQVLEGMSDEMKAATLEALGFEARIQGAVLPLIGTSSAIRRYERELRAAGGTTEEVAKKQMESFSNQMKMIWNQLKVAGIEIGERLVPILKLLGRMLTQLSEWWGGLSNRTKDWIVGVGAIAAAVGPAALAMATLMKMVVALTGAHVALNTAMAANPAVAAAMVAGLSVLAGLAIYEAQMWKFNEEVARSNTLFEKQQAMQRKYREEVIASAKALGDQKDAFLEVEIAKARLELDGYTRKVNAAQEALEGLRSQWWYSKAEEKAAEVEFQQALKSRAGQIEHIRTLKGMVGVQEPPTVKEGTAQDVDAKIEEHLSAMRELMEQQQREAGIPKEFALGL